MVAKAFLTLVGLLYLGLAIWCSFWPATTSKSIGFRLEEGGGQSEFLVVYGGLELALGLIFLRPLWNSDCSYDTLKICLLVHLCLVVFRSVSLFLFHPIPKMTYQLAAGELVILVACGVVLWLSGSSARLA